MSGLLNDPTLDVLGRALQGLAHRENAIATNLANIDTPGYQPVSIDFETALQDAAAAAGAAAPGSGAPGGTGGVALTSSAAARSGIPSADDGMYRTDPRHFNAAGLTEAALPDTVQEFDASARNDGNTVDLESEMTALVETQIRFGAVARLASAKISGLKDVLAS